MRTVDDQQVAALIADGATLAHILDVTGATRSAINKSRQRIGATVTFPRGPQHIDDELVDWLTHDGWSIPRIAEYLGCSTRTVQRARRRNRNTTT